MNDDSLMRRLRAARPVAAEPGNHAALFAQIVAEPGDPRVVEAPHELSFQPFGRKVRLGTRVRPRVLAGGSLALAGVGAALVLVLGGSSAPPAFAITKEGDGSVLVTLNYQQDKNLPQVNRKLGEMGTHERITIYMAPGAAPVSGPVTCRPAPGAPNPSGPRVRVLVGTDGTEVITSGQSAGDTGAGTFHLDHCVVMADTGSNNHA